MEGVLWRGLAAAARVGRQPVPRVEAEVFPLPPRPGAGVRLRETVRQGARRARHPLLRADALAAELRAVEDRQPRVVAAGRGVRRVHRAGLDRDRAYTQ